MSIIFGLLRIVRGFVGFFFIANVITLLNGAAQLAQGAQMTGNAGAILMIKVIFAVVTFVVFVATKWAINGLHNRTVGGPHPAMKKWHSL